MMKWTVAGSGTADCEMLNVHRSAVAPPGASVAGTGFTIVITELVEFEVIVATMGELELLKTETDIVPESPGKADRVQAKVNIVVVQTPPGVMVAEVTARGSRSFTVAMPTMGEYESPTTIGMSTSVKTMPRMPIL